MARQREDRVGLGWMNDLRSIFLLKLDTTCLFRETKEGSRQLKGLTVYINVIVGLWD
jgi:hypothetical protein